MSLFVNSPQDWSYLSQTGNSVKPAANVINDKNAFVIELMAPGMQKDDFQIQVMNNLLVIEGSHQENLLPNNKEVYREFPHEQIQFHRSFELDPYVIQEGYKISYKQGILSIFFQKRQNVTPEANNRSCNSLKKGKEFLNKVSG